MASVQILHWCYQRAPPPLPQRASACVECGTVFTHVVIILWIFLKGRLLNARSACTVGGRGGVASTCACREISLWLLPSGGRLTEEIKPLLFRLTKHGSDVVLIMVSELWGNPYRCGTRFWINKCDGPLSPVFPTSVRPPARFSARLLFPLWLPAAVPVSYHPHFLAGALHSALIAARECVELGHFSMAAVQQRTVPLAPAREYWCQMSVQAERKREKGGGGAESSHIKHVPVEIQALFCLLAKNIIALWRLDDQSSWFLWTFFHPFEMKRDQTDTRKLCLISLLFSTVSPILEFPIYISFKNFFHPKNHTKAHKQTNAGIPVAPHTEVMEPFFPLHT